MTNERNQAIQGVLDRITSYQDGAPDGTVERELREGLDEAGVEVSDEELRALVDAAEKVDSPVHADEVLGSADD